MMAPSRSAKKVTIAKRGKSHARAGEDVSDGRTKVNAVIRYEIREPEAQSLPWQSCQRRL